MKPKQFAITTSAILAAAMLSHGQTQDDQRTGVTGAAADRATATGGDPATGQSTATDGATAPGQHVPDRQSAGSATDDAATGAQDDAQRDADGQLARSEAERAARATEKLRMDWSDATEKEVQLSSLPPRVRDTLTTVADEQQIDDKIVQRSKGGHTVYCATVERPNEENLKIFVQPDGTVVKTKQKVDFSDAPQAVQAAFRDKAGGSRDSQPQQLHRIIADEQTFYTAAGDKEDKKDGDKLIVDNSGKRIDTMAAREGASDSASRDAVASDDRERARREARERRDREADPRAQEGESLRDEELGTDNPRPQD